MGPSFRQQLAEKVDIRWSGTPLKTALENLAKAKEVAFLLDRRVDPGQIVELTVSDKPLEAALQSLAAAQHLEISLLDSVIYVGPPEAADPLRTIAELRKEEVEKLPQAARGPFTRQHSWHWDDLATPRELLTGLATESGIKITGIDELPHDLWGKADLPALSFSDRLTLVAVQFDRTFAIDADGKSVRLVPIPAHVTLRKTYTPDASANILGSQLANAAPRAKVEFNAGKVAVEGRVEDHELIQAMLMSRKASQTPAAVPDTKASEANKRYTLTVKDAPVGRLLTELGKKMNLKIHVDEAAVQQAGLSLTALVSLEVKEVTADDLLRAACQPAGLAFRRTDAGVEVFPGQKAKK